MRLQQRWINQQMKVGEKLWALTMWVKAMFLPFLCCGKLSSAKWPKCRCMVNDFAIILVTSGCLSKVTTLFSLPVRTASLEHFRTIHLTDSWEQLRPLWRLWKVMPPPPSEIGTSYSTRPTSGWGNSEKGDLTYTENSRLPTRANSKERTLWPNKHYPLPVHYSKTGKTAKNVNI